MLSFSESKRLMEKYKIPFIESRMVENKKEALGIAKEIGFPVVLKISSPKIVHKTEIEGVEPGIESEKQLKKSYEKISKLAEEKGAKVLLQKMQEGKEVVIGMKKDSSFGPVIMFGLGGIFVEILEDVVFRVAPVSKKEALKMMKEIKGYPVLKGVRGEEPVNKEALAEVIVNTSILSLKEEDLEEIDFNPVICNSKDAKVADAKFFPKSETRNSL